MITTDKIIKEINESHIKTISELINRLQKYVPDIREINILHKQDMGLYGIMSATRFYLGDDEIIVKGYLYPTENWSEKTHGYVKATKI